MVLPLSRLYEPIISDRYPLEPFSFRSADEVLRDDAVDSNAATLADVVDRVDNGLSSNGLPRCRIAESHRTSPSSMTLQTFRNLMKKWIEDAVEPVVIALQEEGEDLRRCRQRAIELEEKELLRKRQIIQMMRRRAGRWSPTRRSKNGKVQKGAERAGRGSKGKHSVGVGAAAVVPMSVRSRPAGIPSGSGYSPATAAGALVSTNSLRRSIRRHLRITSLLRYL